MNSDEQNLWVRCREGDDVACKELVLFYLPLATYWAKRISRSAGWANPDDLKQEGVIGLIKAVRRFDPNRGVSFNAFARSFIRGAIFDSSEFTRDLARRQKEIYLTIRRAEVELSNALQRNPTIEEVAKKTELTTQQIRNALDAIGLASAGEIPDPESAALMRTVETPDPERTLALMEALSRLSARENEIIQLCYWKGMSPEETAQVMGLTVSNVIKIRQRANKKLRKLLDARERGGHDE
jgi:RNA polymerase sigma factor (sigma-70 family)